jgi:hypothetical protein
MEERWIIIKKIIKILICWLFGHKPRGPVEMNPVLYRCDRCRQLMYFDLKRGWMVK